jgi:hypothetical protein
MRLRDQGTDRRHDDHLSAGARRESVIALDDYTLVIIWLAAKRSNTLYRYHTFLEELDRSAYIDAL